MYHILVISNFLESTGCVHLYPHISILHPVMECQSLFCVTFSGCPLKPSWKLQWLHNCFILYDCKANIKFMVTSSSEFLNNRFCPLDHRCTGVWVPEFLYLGKTFAKWSSTREHARTLLSKESFKWATAFIVLMSKIQPITQIPTKNISYCLYAKYMLSFNETLLLLKNMSHS